MAIDGYTINGPALVYTGTGNAGALELLGYTTDGVDVRITENVEPIMTDLLGTQTPQDFQDMGMVAEITAPLIAIDRAVLAKVMGRGNRAAAGLLSTPGNVKGAGGWAFRLGISSSADSPWSFAAAILRPTAQFRLSTKAQPLTLQFFAWPYVSYTATTALNAVLWTRSLS